jgi:hypothetical protein
MRHDGAGQRRYKARCRLARAGTTETILGDNKQSNENGNES